jgi:hypothetical protein
MGPSLQNFTVQVVQTRTHATELSPVSAMAVPFRSNLVQPRSPAGAVAPVRGTDTHGACHGGRTCDGASPSACQCALLSDRLRAPLHRCKRGRLWVDGRTEASRRCPAARPPVGAQCARAAGCAELETQSCSADLESDVETDCCWLEPGPASTAVARPWYGVVGYD